MFNTVHIPYFKVFEVRGNRYVGELGGRTGLVAANHVEKCEWIYGNSAIDKGFLSHHSHLID